MAQPKLNDMVFLNRQINGPELNSNIIHSAETTPPFPHVSPLQPPSYPLRPSIIPKGPKGRSLLTLQNVA